MKKTCRTRGEGLDIVEAAHSKRVSSFLYCRMEIVGKIEPERLKKAVRQSCKFVPEIIYTFDFRYCEFVDKGLTMDGVVMVENGGRKSKKQRSPCQEIWDLSSGPQFRIFIQEKEQGSKIVFAMSYILSDGKGFLQYLYLLIRLYHRKEQRQSNVLYK